VIASALCQIEIFAICLSLPSREPPYNLIIIILLIIITIIIIIIIIIIY